MRRLITILFIFMAAAVSAQFRYGLRVGGVFETPNGFWSGGSGFAGGLTCEWESPRSGLALGASVNYERRTIDYDGYVTIDRGWSTPDDAGGDFIAVPLEVRYKFMLPALKELAGPYVLTGPDIAVRLNRASGHPVHVGWNIGVGFDVISHFQVSGGYRFGINNVDEDGMRDSGAWVSVAFLFDI